MSRNINKHAFFDAYHQAFGKLRQEQVDGLDFLLDGLAVDENVSDVRWAAYILATVKHETADTFQPITEFGGRAYFDKYDTGKLSQALGNTPEADGDGYTYRGRGYVMLTGRANYERMGKGCSDRQWPEHDAIVYPGMPKRARAIHQCHARHPRRAGAHESRGEAPEREAQTAYGRPSGRENSGAE